MLVLAYPPPTEFDTEIKYLCIELHDDYKSNMFMHLAPGIEFIQEALSQHQVASKANLNASKKGGVLIASNKGECRGPAFACAYLMYVKRMTLPNAIAFVKLKRRQANPNASYMRQLESLENTLKVGKELGTATTSEVVKYMQHERNHRKPYTVFRGLKPSQSIV